jgi:insulysin
MLCVSGYTDKLPLLQSVVLEKIRNLQVEEGAFNLVHDRLVRAYKNAKLNKWVCLSLSLALWFCFTQ